MHIWKERNNTKVQYYIMVVSCKLKGFKQERPDKRKVYLDLLSNYVYERKTDKSLSLFFFFFLQKWPHFTPQWCTESGRASLSSGKSTAEQCEEKCKSGCLSVEWWENMRLCYEWTAPSKKTAYTNTEDLAYRPKPRQTKITLDGLVPPRFVRFCETH